MYPRGASTDEQSPMFFPASPTYMNRQFGVPIQSNLELGSMASSSQAAWQSPSHLTREVPQADPAGWGQERSPMLGPEVSQPQSGLRHRVKAVRNPKSKELAGQELRQFHKSQSEIKKRASKMTEEERKKRREQLAKGVRTKHQAQHRAVHDQFTTGWREVVTVIIIFLGSPLIAVAAIASIFLFCLPNVLLHIYAHCQRKPTPIIQSTCGWRLFTLLMFILYLPGLIFTIAYFISSFLLIHFIAFIPGLLFNVHNWEENFRVLAPYCAMDRFWLWGWTFPDFLRGVAQQQFRQGFWEFNLTLPYSYSVTPFIKYAICCNVFFMKLKESFISQWTWKIPDMSVDDCYFAMKYNISYALHDDVSRADIDDDCFSAHYPFVPDRREIPEVLGVQFAGMIQITHTEHQYHNIARSPDIHMEKGGRPVYIVRLYYWNPWHMLTGYVEANIQWSSRMEHPMWCVLGQNRMAQWILNNIDQLFFRYGPEVAAFAEREGTEAHKHQDNDFDVTQRLDARKFGQKAWAQDENIPVNPQHNAGWAGIH